MQAMKQFIVYDISKGKILRTGHCPSELVELQAGAGEAIIEGTADDKTDIVIDGKLIENAIAPPQRHPLPIGRITAEYDDLFLDLENRIRKIEGRPGISKDEYIAATKEKP
jgi:hypothetical protein